MQIPGQPETLSLVKSNTKTYLSLILRLPAQWVHQQARTNHHCHGCPCEAVGKPWLNWEGCLSESVRVCQLFHTSEHVAEEGLLSVIKETFRNNLSSPHHEYLGIAVGMALNA
ncbi:uncharacterized protein LOC118519358 isoform X3 [Halichoerus grypus]